MNAVTDSVTGPRRHDRFRTRHRRTARRVARYFGRDKGRRLPRRRPDRRQLPLHTERFVSVRGGHPGIDLDRDRRLQRSAHRPGFRSDYSPPRRRGSSTTSAPFAPVSVCMGSHALYALAASPTAAATDHRDAVIASGGDAFGGAPSQQRSATPAGYAGAGRRVLCETIRVGSSAMTFKIEGPTSTSTRMTAAVAATSWAHRTRRLRDQRRRRDGCGPVRQNETDFGLVTPYQPESLVSRYRWFESRGNAGTFRCRRPVAGRRAGHRRLLVLCPPAGEIGTR